MLLSRAFSVSTTPPVRRNPESTRRGILKMSYYICACRCDAKRRGLAIHGWRLPPFSLLCIWFEYTTSVHSTRIALRVPAKKKKTQFSLASLSIQQLVLINVFNTHEIVYVYECMYALHIFTCGTCVIYVCAAGAKRQALNRYAHERVHIKCNKFPSPSLVFRSGRRDDRARERRCFCDVHKALECVLHLAECEDFQYFNKT